MTDVTLIRGVLVTVLTTVLVRTPEEDSPPLTVVFLSRYVGDGRPEEYTKPGTTLHLVYGAGDGVVLSVGGVETVEPVGAVSGAGSSCSSSRRCSG
jgi:hypothetical protein